MLKKKLKLIKILIQKSYEVKRFYDNVDDVLLDGTKKTLPI